MWVRLKALVFFKAIEPGLNGLEQGQSLLNIRVSQSNGKFKTPDIIMTEK